MADGEEDFPRFPLRLLIASKCANATAAGLAVALPHLPRLQFLDLSETTAARDGAVLRSLRCLEDLQVLKLRSTGLRDGDVEILADAIKIRVRSLDVSSNRLTDVSVRTLLSKCLHATRDVHTEHARLRRQRRRDSDWPSGIPIPYDSLLTQLRGSDFDEKMLQRLTKPSAGSIISEDLPPTGVTHLYISDNFISMEGIASLVRTENLHVLDAAAIDTNKALGGPRARGSFSLPLNAVPGAEKLTPLLEKHGKLNLTYLRINHAVVTQPAGSRDDPDAPIELDGAVPHHELEAAERQTTELDGTAAAATEMPAAASVYELSTDEPTPRYELPVDPFQFTNPFNAGAPALMVTEEANDQVRRGSVFAPEVVTDGRRDSETEAVQAASSQTASNNGPQQAAPTAGSEAAECKEDGTLAEIYKIEQRRRQLRKDTVDTGRGLLPGSLPALRILVLTDVPPFDDTKGRVVDALERFITDCATESELALAQASLEFPSYCVPGKPRSAHKLHRSRELFGLRQIVLELSSQPKHALSRLRSPSDSSDSPQSPMSPVLHSWLQGFNQPQRSSTGDPDTEAFWKAQEHDFSFFGEEECGQPLDDPGRNLPRRIVEEKMAVPMEPEPGEMVLLSPVATGGFQPTSAPPYSQTAESQTRDVVAELARWRREKKRQAEALGSEGGEGDGHWRGEIKIVRQESQKQQGYVDWYGNYYTKGVYR